MAKAGRAFVAGFLAASRLYEKERAAKNGKGSTPPLPRRPESPPENRALESYLATPAFIRHGVRLSR
ncbi:MAG: hypothetical protein OEV91_02665 [Desulfobulbaceae bacterium]|nr:hypothetical protein [Desulfobulbaceae bacterium]